MIVDMGEEYGSTVDINKEISGPQHTEFMHQLLMYVH